MLQGRTTPLRGSSPSLAVSVPREKNWKRVGEQTCILNMRRDCKHAVPVQRIRVAPDTLAHQPQIRGQVMHAGYRRIDGVGGWVQRVPRVYVLIRERQNRGQLRHKILAI
jgi:hypothetical protein